MNRLILATMIVALAGCTAAQTAKVNTALSSPAGQLFCALDEGAAGQVVVGVIDAAASSANVGQVAVLATGATQSFVQAACAAAAKSAGATVGIPVSPPAATVPNVAVVTAALPAP
jgi:hypothetical protein